MTQVSEAAEINKQPILDVLVPLSALLYCDAVKNWINSVLYVNNLSPLLDHGCKNRFLPLTEADKILEVPKWVYLCDESLTTLYLS
jgi:hypothetical protein